MLTPAIRKGFAWLIRAAVVLAFIPLTALPPVYVSIGPPQPVVSAHPVTCVHTRLVDEVEEWKIQRSLIRVHEMGAPTIVEFFPWAYVESTEGVYDWTRTDLILRHAAAQGLTVIARLGLVPEWALPKTDNPDQAVSLNTLTPEHYGEFADFVEAFAERYRGQVDHIIIWNEPNLAFEWGYQPVDPAQYAELLALSYAAAHRGNPDVIVLGGALAPTLEPVGSPFGMNDLDYLEKLYEYGAGEHFDALAVHAYGLKFPPDDPPSPDVLNFRRVELIRQIMVKHDDEDTPIYITESGWNDHPRWTKAVRPGQRIAYTIDGLEFAEANWPWVKNLCVWVLRYPAPTQSYPDYFTLLTPDFSPRPIYDALKEWAIDQ